MVDLDFTRLNVPVKKHDSCTVIDVSSGTFPRYIEVRMPGTDGARRTAIWDGLLNLANDDKVICEEYPGQPILRIVGFGGDQDASTDPVRVTKLWESDLGAAAWSTNATGDLSAAGAYDLTTTGDLSANDGNFSGNVLLSTAGVIGGTGGSEPSVGASAAAFRVSNIYLASGAQIDATNSLTLSGSSVDLLKITAAAQDLVEIGDVGGGSGDVDVDVNNGVLFLDGATDDLTLTGGDVISNQATRAQEHDFALHDTANDLGVASHFLDNDSSYPAGWTEVDAAGYTDTNTRYSYWLLLGSSSDTSWDYKAQGSIDLEVDVAPSGTITVVIGPLMWRDTAFTADVNYYLGLYRDSSGIDTATYARIRLRFDSSAGLWKIRGEESDGSTPHTGTEYTLDSAPYNQPLYVSVTLNNAASKSIQCYWGKVNDFALQTLLFNQSPSSAPTWGTFWVRFHQSRGTGSADRILIGGVDSQ